METCRDLAMLVAVFEIITNVLMRVFNTDCSVLHLFPLAVKNLPRDNCAYAVCDK